MKRNVRNIMFVELFALVLVMVFNIVIGCNSGMGIIYFIDLPSLLLIILFIVPAMSVMGLWKDFFRSLHVGKRTYSVTQLQKTVESIKMMEKLTICGATFSVMVAVMLILVTIDNTEYLGPNLAVAILSILYGAAIEFFLIPLRTNTQIHILEMMEYENEEE